MKVIIVSGSVGSGKTTIAKKIAKEKNYKYIDVNKLIIKNKLYQGYDKKLKTRLVDTNILNKFLIGLIKNFAGKGLVIDSHLSHYLPEKYVDLCIITKTGLKTLKKRLKKREYSMDKIKENLEAEILDVCLIESKENKHKVKVVYT